MAVNWLGWCALCRSVYAQFADPTLMWVWCSTHECPGQFVRISHHPRYMSAHMLGGIHAVVAMLNEEYPE